MSFIYCHLNFHDNLLRPWRFPLMEIFVIKKKEKKKINTADKAIHKKIFVWCVLAIPPKSALPRNIEQQNVSYQYLRQNNVGVESLPHLNPYTQKTIFLLTCGNGKFTYEQNVDILNYVFEYKKKYNRFLNV